MDGPSRPRPVHLGAEGVPVTDATFPIVGPRTFQANKAENSGRSTPAGLAYLAIVWVEFHGISDMVTGTLIRPRRGIC